MLPSSMLGSGASLLLDYLQRLVIMTWSALDIAAEALAHSQKRLADKAQNISWHVTDVLNFSNPSPLTFMIRRLSLFTDESESKSQEVLSRSLKPKDWLINMTFALDEPQAL
ncbi:MAG: class I SAM-dependent methyltransferase [Deinococcales bacterium]